MPWSCRESCKALVRLTDWWPYISTLVWGLECSDAWFGGEGGEEHSDEIAGLSVVTSKSHCLLYFFMHLKHLCVAYIISVRGS